MGDRLGIPGAVSFFECPLQPAEGAVAAASKEKDLGKSRKDSPSKKKSIWKSHIITEGRERTFK